MKKFYTTGEVAKELEVSIETVSNWIKKGLIRAIIFPTGQRRIPREEIDKILNDNQNANPHN